MHPILLKFGAISIYSYGAMVALGFGIATAFIYLRVPHHSTKDGSPSFDTAGLDKDKVVDLSIILLLSGIIGARLLFVLLNLGYYLANPLEIPNLSRGGLIWYGGFLSSFLALVWYLRKKGLDFWAVTDLIVPYVALAQGLGRIGCFLNGCCYGMEVTSGYPLGVMFPQEAVLRHPTQIYSALALFWIFVILRIWQNVRHFRGEIFLAYCILYSAKRFGMEFLRGDNARFFGLTLSQDISIVVFLIAAVFFFYRARKWQKSISSLK